MEIKLENCDMIFSRACAYIEKGVDNMLNDMTHIGFENLKDTTVTGYDVKVDLANNKATFVLKTDDD